MGPDSLLALADKIDDPHTDELPNGDQFRALANAWEAERTDNTTCLVRTTSCGWLRISGQDLYDENAAMQARIEALERALCGDDTERERLRSLWGLPALAAGEG